VMKNMVDCGIQLSLRKTFLSYLYKLSRVEPYLGENTCQTTSRTKALKTEAASAYWSRTKSSIGPTNSMYRRNGSRRPCGTSGIPWTPWKKN
jgi:hypothetical protein